MKNVTMKKQDLIKILETNRKEFIEEYEEAFEAYKKKVVEEAEATLEKIKENPEKSWKYLRIEATLPQNHTRDYDQAISMLEHEVGDTVVLTKEEYTQLVLDEWEWAREFANTYHMSTAKLSKFG